MTSHSQQLELLAASPRECHIASAVVCSNLITFTWCRQVYPTQRADWRKLPSSKQCARDSTHCPGHPLAR